MRGAERYGDTHNQDKQKLLHSYIMVVPRRFWETSGPFLTLIPMLNVSTRPKSIAMKLSPKSSFTSIHETRLFNQLVEIKPTSRCVSRRLPLSKSKWGFISWRTYTTQYGDLLRQHTPHDTPGHRRSSPNLAHDLHHEIPEAFSRYTGLPTGF